MTPIVATSTSVVVLVVSIIALVFGIIKLKIHPLFALIFVSTAAAFGFGIPIGQVFSTVTTGFGNTIASIGIVIILGCAIGIILEDTGGALVLANSILKVVGKQRSELTMGITGYLVSIPVFSDSAIVILSPVAKALSARGGMPMMALLGALNGGILATHTMVPPTPGPIAAAGTLGADLGLVIALGMISSVAYTWASMAWCGSKKMLAKYPALAELPPIHSISAVSALDENGTSPTKEPAAIYAFGAILLPVILICISSFSRIWLDPKSAALPILGFIGHPICALFLGVLVALGLEPKRLSWDQFYKWCDTAVEKSGFIILATGAAGAFGAVLRASGVGTYLGEAIAATALPPVLIPYLVSVALSVATGSATVSLIIGSGIILPLLPALGLHPVIATLAIAAGSSFFYHLNASHFWVVLKANGDLPVNQGFDLVSIPSALGSVAAMAVVWVMSIFI